MLKEKLQLIKDNDTNLYDHLVSVLRHLIISNDRNGFEMFQYYCQNVKNIQGGEHNYRN